MFSPKNEKVAIPQQPGSLTSQGSGKGISLPAVPALQRMDLDKEEEKVPEKEVSQFKDLKEELPEKALQTKSIVQREAANSTSTPNHTGMPNNLKTGIEQLSGFDMSDVRVHYNSEKPAQLNALAFAQGTDIHVGAGQEKHLAHEAWHVAQQKQGRVQATMQLKTGVPVNDDPALENEADVMGAKALSGSFAQQVQPLQRFSALPFGPVIQNALPNGVKTEKRKGGVIEGAAVLEVKNEVISDSGSKADLSGINVKEQIVEVDKDDSFEFDSHFNSGYISATEDRVDYHAVSLQAIRTDKAKEGHQFWVRQNFIYKSGAAGEEKVVPNSGFDITHTLTKNSEEEKKEGSKDSKATWVDKIKKEGAKVKIGGFESEAGTGSASVSVPLP